MLNTARARNMSNLKVDEGQAVFLQIYAVEESGITANHSQVVPQDLSGSRDESPKLIF